MGLAHVADFSREEIPRARTNIGGPGVPAGPAASNGFRGRGHSNRSPVLAPRITRRRARGSWYWRLYVWR
jgi:hypothetical protein